MLRGALLGTLCALLAGALYLFDPTLFGAEWWLFDAYSRRLASSRKPDPRIVLVTVSETTARALAADFGRPQAYSRELYARALEELMRDGAALVAFDIHFAEPNDADSAGDRRFAERLATSAAILGAQTEAPHEQRKLEPMNNFWAPKVWFVRGHPPKRQFNAVTPHDAFAAVPGIGTMRLETTAGSASVHHYPLADPMFGGHMPSLALESARRFLGGPRTAVHWRDRFTFGKRVVPVDENLRMLIRWNGAKAKDEELSYSVVGFEKLLMASYAREERSESPERLAQFAAQFKGKIVLVGFTAAGLLDVRATPLSAKSAGIEIHANALDNLLNGDFTRVAPVSAVFPIILAIGAAFGAAIGYVRSQLLGGIIAIAALGLVAVAGYLALQNGLQVPAFTALAAIALTYLVITVVKFVAEQQQTAALRATFGRYVSPQILQHILAHPEKVRLGGERRDLTILFSDIRGFTSISEASEPEEVVEMLNEYLTKMVDILLDHGGTLDKFIGDAVMGFWNAPAADPDHARHAVACAVEMVRETARLRERWEGEGKPALRIGVGVNTGEAVAGNIGAEKVFGYTVIGDAVNLASRLEGKNKDYGTEVIISEFTLARIGDAFETVYLDDVKVKGKDKAVKIYQVRT